MLSRNREPSQREATWAVAAPAGIDTAGQNMRNLTGSRVRQCGALDLDQQQRLSGLDDEIRLLFIMRGTGRRP